MAKKLKKNYNSIKCNLDDCTKDAPHSVDTDAFGSPVGDGTTLARNIMTKYFTSGKKADTLPISVKRGQAGAHRDFTAQAHHLICSESFTVGGGVIDEKWERVCSIHGYDINCGENGVFFPAYMPIACHFRIPLHLGNHDAAKTKDGRLYVNAVRSLVDPLRDKALVGEYCEEEDGKFIKKMNRKSKDIYGNVISFDWQLTTNGRNFKGRRQAGCLGCTEIKEYDTTFDAKIIKKCTALPISRNHSFLWASIPKLLGLGKTYKFKDAK